MKTEETLGDQSDVLEVKTADLALIAHALWLADDMLRAQTTTYENSEKFLHINNAIHLCEKILR